MEKSAVPADLNVMKKNDLRLIAALVILAAAAFGGVMLYARLSTKEPEAVVYLEGEEKAGGGAAVLSGARPVPTAGL